MQQRYLIELHLPFDINIGPIVSTGASSVMRICDGLGIMHTQLGGVGPTYTYFDDVLQSMSDYTHSVDIKHGGNFEDGLGGFSFTINDNGISEGLEELGYSLNSGSVILYSWLGGVTEKLYTGYVNNSELKEGLIIIDVSAINNKLGVLTKPVDFGYTFKLPLKRDDSFSVTNFRFLNLKGTYTDNPRIINTQSMASPNDTYLGTTRSSSTYGGARIIIAHVNDVFANQGDASGTYVVPLVGPVYYFKENLFVNFVTGDSANVSQNYRVDSIIRIIEKGGIHPEYQTQLILKDVAFGSINIAAYDRLTVYQGISYYLIGDDGPNISNVYIKDGDNYFSANKDAYKIVNKNGKNYIALYTRRDIYNEIPCTSMSMSYYMSNSRDSVTYSAVVPMKYTVSGTDYYTSIDPALALDNDLSTYIAPDTHTRYSANTFAYHMDGKLTLSLKPVLTNISKQDLYLGALIDAPLSNNINVDVSSYITLISGEVYPCSNAGTPSAPAFMQATCGQDGLHDVFAPFYINSVPMGEICSPTNTVGTYTPTPLTVASNYRSGFTTQYTSISNPAGFFSFDANKMHKIDAAPEVYPEIDTISLCLNNWCRAGDWTESPFSNLSTFIFKVGIWAKINVDSVETLYVDTTGVTDVDTTNFTPDSYIKKVVTDSGNSVATGYGLTGSDIPMNNYYTAYMGDGIADTIVNIANPANLVVGQDADGNFYCNPVSMLKQDNSYSALTLFVPNHPNHIVPIPTEQILGIPEGLKDLDITEIINLPKIILNDKLGNQQYFELYNLAGTFPTLEQITADPTLLNAFYNFSPDFWSKFPNGAVETPYYTGIYVYLLQPIYLICLDSFKKNNIATKGDITLPTFYMEYLPNTITLQAQLVNYVYSYAKRRKTLTVTVGFDWRHTQLGTEVSINDPRLYAQSTVYGYVTGVKVYPYDAKVDLTLLCDYTAFNTANADWMDNVGNDTDYIHPNTPDMVVNYGENETTDLVESLIKV